MEVGSRAVFQSPSLWLALSQSWMPSPITALHSALLNICSLAYTALDVETEKAQ